MVHRASGTPTDVRGSGEAPLSTADNVRIRHAAPDVSKVHHINEELIVAVHPDGAAAGSRWGGHPSTATRAHLDAS